MAKLFVLKVAIFSIAMTAAESQSQMLQVGAELRPLAMRQSLYSIQPQAYYYPQHYQLAPAIGYVAHAGNKLRTYPVEPTPKSLILPGYKAPARAKPSSPQLIEQPLITYVNTDVKSHHYAAAKTIPTSTGKHVPLSIPAPHSSHNSIEKQYKYGYRVSNPQNGAEFGHSEVHDGQDAKGYYHVLLPDGRLQNVEYCAGSSGFHATITYENSH